MSEKTSKIFIDLAYNDYKSVEDYIQVNPEILDYKDKNENNLLYYCNNENMINLFLSLKPSLLKEFNKDELTPLMIAVSKNNFNFAKLYVDFDSDNVNISNNNEITAIDILLENNSIDFLMYVFNICKIEIKNNYLVKMLDKNFLTLFKIALDKSENLNFVNNEFSELLINKNDKSYIKLVFNKNSDFFDNRILKFSLFEKKYLIFDFLLDNNIVPYFNIEGKSSFSFLIENQQSLIAKKFANFLSTEQINEISEEGKTSLDYTINNFIFSLINFLVRKNAIIKSKESLISLLASNHHDLVRKFYSEFPKDDDLIFDLYLTAIKSGKLENIDFLYNDMRINTSYKNQKKLLNVLIEKFVSINQKTYEPLVDYLKVLFKLKLNNINEKTDRFYFFDAIIDGNLSLIEEFFDYSLIILVDENNNNGLMYAVMNNQKEIALFLIKNKIDINNMNKNKHTPLTQAIINKNLDLINILLANGAILGSINNENDPINFADNKLKTKISNLLINIKNCSNTKDPFTRENLEPNLLMSIAWEYEIISVMCYEIISLQNYLKFQEPQNFSSITNENQIISVIVIPFNKMILSNDISLLLDYNRRLHANVVDFVEYENQLVPVYQLKKI